MKSSWCSCLWSVLLDIFSRGNGSSLAFFGGISAWIYWPVFNEDFVVEVERFSIYSGYYDKYLTYFLIIWTAFLFSLDYPQMHTSLKLLWRTVCQLNVVTWVTHKEQWPHSLLRSFYSVMSSCTRFIVLILIITHLIFDLVKGLG